VRGNDRGAGAATTVERVLQRGDRSVALRSEERGRQRGDRSVALGAWEGV
jgi:hypothetical protein